MPALLPVRKSRKSSTSGTVPEIRPLGVYDGVQAAAVLRMSARRLGKLVKSGELRAAEGTRGKLLYMGSDLIRFIKARRVAPEAH